MIDSEDKVEIKQIFPELSYSKAVHILLKIYKDVDYERKASNDVFKRLEERRVLENDQPIIKKQEEVAECQDKLQEDQTQNQQAQKIV